MMPGSRTALALAAAVLVAGCSSGGGNSDSPSGHAAATAAQDQVVSAARALYQRIYGAHIGWTTGLSGQYEQCLTDSSQGELDFHGIIYYLYPFSSSTTSDAYRQDVMSSAQAAGWTFKKFIKASRDGNLFPYQMEKGSLDGHIAVANAPAGTKSFKFSAVIEIESTCFDAGSAARSLTQHSSQFSLPHPSPLPTA